MKHGLTLLLSVTLLAGLAGCDLGDKGVKTAVINTHDVVTKCNIGLQTVEEIQKQFDERRNALKTQEDAIRKLQETPGISDPNAPKHGELQRSLLAYAEASRQLRRDVAAEEAVKFKPVVDKINKVLAAYAKEKGLVSVQDTKGFAYIDPRIDITEAIIKRIDQAQ